MISPVLATFLAAFGATYLLGKRILDSVLNAILESLVFNRRPVAVRFARFRKACLIGVL